MSRPMFTQEQILKETIQYQRGEAPDSEVHKVWQKWMKRHINLDEELLDDGFQGFNERKPE